MPEFEKKPYSKDDYDKNTEDAGSLKKQMAEAKTADEMMEIAKKMKAVEGNENELMGNAQEEAGKEDAERTKEKEKAEARAKELEGLKLKDETESAEKAEEILKKLRGVGESSEIQAERVRLKNLEERYKIDKEITPDDKEMISRYETQIRITKRKVEGKPVEGETEEEKEEYRKFMGAMSEEEIEREREKISKKKQL